MAVAFNIALLLWAQAQPVQVRHERVGDDRYRLYLSASHLSDVGAAQALLLPTAQQLCGSLLPSFGRYSWRATERLESAEGSREPVSLTLEQDISCSTSVPVPVEAAAPHVGWRPSDAAERAVRAATDAYFAARDSGRFGAGYAMLAPSNQAVTPLASWTERARAFNVRAGTLRSNRLIRVTWYDNPPSAPEPGIYAAVDFSGDYENLHFVCGSLVWLLQPDNSWRLVSEEQNILARVDAPNMTASEAAHLRSQFGCRDTP